MQEFHDNRVAIHCYLPRHLVHHIQEPDVQIKVLKGEVEGSRTTHGGMIPRRRSGERDFLGMITAAEPFQRVRNRRGAALASLAGLTPTPYSTGKTDR